MISSQPRASNSLRIIVILGPTASGKSDLAVFLAKKFGGEVVSADSRQVYKGLDIGTGKITKREMGGVPHHLLDIASPKKQISVSQYQQKAEKTIRDIIARGKLPIVIGGSGMYIDAILYGAPYPEVPPNRKLRARLEKKTAEALFQELQKKDPARAETIDRHNKRRLVRALEIIAATGKPVPPLEKTPRYAPLILGVLRTKKELEKRIKTRLHARLKGGMIGEAKKLLAAGISHKRLYELGLEYRYLSEFLRKKISRAELAQELAHAIKQYAKRQMTWFRQYPQTRWIKTRAAAQKEVTRFLK